MYNDSAEEKARPLDGLDSGIANLGFLGNDEADDDEYEDDYEDYDDFGNIGVASKGSKLFGRSQQPQALVLKNKLKRQGFTVRIQRAGNRIKVSWKKKVTLGPVKPPPTKAALIAYWAKRGQGPCGIRSRARCRPGSVWRCIGTKWTCVPAKAAKQIPFLKKRFIPKRVNRIKAIKTAQNKLLSKYLPRKKIIQANKTARKMKKNANTVAKMIKARKGALRRLRANKGITKAEYRKSRKDQTFRMKKLASAYAKRKALLKSNMLRAASRTKRDKKARAELKAILKKARENKISRNLARNLALKRIAKLNLPAEQKQMVADKFEERARGEIITRRQYKEKRTRQKLTVAKQKLRSERDKKAMAKRIYRANIRKAKKTLRDQKRILQKAVKAKVIKPELAREMMAKQVKIAKKTLTPVPKQILKVFPTPVKFTREQKVVVHRPPMPPEVVTKPKHTVIIMPIMVTEKLRPTPTWLRPKTTDEVKVIRKGDSKEPVPTVKVHTRPAERAEFITVPSDTPQAAPKPVTTTATKFKIPDVFNKFVSAFTTTELPRF